MPYIHCYVALIIMKKLTLTIKNCTDCPYCKKDKWLYSFICEKSNSSICVDNKTPNIPDFCELPNAIL